jgi:hypothetical protein
MITGGDASMAFAERFVLRAAGSDPQDIGRTIAGGSR